MEPESIVSAEEEEKLPLFVDKEEEDTKNSSTEVVRFVQDVEGTESLIPTEDQTHRRDPRTRTFGDISEIDSKSEGENTSGIKLSPNSDSSSPLEDPDIKSIQEELEGITFSDVYELKSDTIKTKRSNGDSKSDSKQDFHSCNPIPSPNSRMSEDRHETTSLVSGVSGNNQSGYVPGCADPRCCPQVFGKKKKKRAKKGVSLNYVSASELEYQVQMNLIKHNIASKYFASRNFWLFTIPQAVFTMLTSILAFVSTSELLLNRQKIFIATVVGSLSGVVVFLQTLAGVCNYETRSSMHSSASIDMRDLRDEIILIKFKLKKEETDTKGGGNGKIGKTRDNKSVSIASQSKSDENSDSDSDSDSDDESITEEDNTFGRIQQRYRQSLSGCKSIVPMEVSEAFHGMKSNLMIMDSIDQKKYMASVYGPKKDYHNLIYFKAFDILAEEIMEHWMFPISLPNPRMIVGKAMKQLEDRLDESHNYWDKKEREKLQIEAKQFEEDKKYKEKYGEKFFNQFESYDDESKNLVEPVKSVGQAEQV
mmetsp:Transcript_27546/g.64638  ORF Transcript_27546/g.64638 Transcript_27546/m.64638 type:complete len:536 (+) Transcript_27546:66-1673(+)